MEQDFNASLTESSASVQTHLKLLQGVIERMAANSAMAKGWCITIAAAILVLVADKSKQDYAYLAFIPTLLFWALDVYYLGMEKGFRDSYNQFVAKLHRSELAVEDLYSVGVEGHPSVLQLRAAMSFSVWGFYVGLALLILLARLLVLNTA